MNRYEPIKNELSMYREVEESLSKIIAKYEKIERDSGSPIVGLIVLKDIFEIYSTNRPDVLGLFTNHVDDFPRSFEPYFALIRKYV